ncbi:MAG: sulfatase-like hydrolase/transferase, partial [Verrucomicrobiota bacterium]
MNKITPLALAAILAGTFTGAGFVHGAERPNIIFILSDDVGYGDVGCYGATHVKTPNIDRLAKEGTRFTDAHATASVCTPTRYAFMTGRYAWRQPGTGIARGDSPALIKPGTVTVPSMLKQAGYATGVVGKWHLGLGESRTDFNGEIKPGPLELGFDYAFIIPATGDRVPCVFVENHRVVGYDPADPIQVSYGKKIGDEPTGDDAAVKLKIKGGPGHHDSVVNGIPRIGFMTGGKTARWVDEDIADTLASKSVKFIESHKNSPFFLYLATHDIHEPMVPHPRFRGTSDCGWRGDVIHQLDWTVGEILATLDRLKLATNTLVIFTSDNGGAIKNTYDDGTNPLHGRQKPNGLLRGAKGSLYEGGHREPFIARWPGHIPAGGTSSRLMGHVDTLATLAALTGQSLPAEAAPDSFNVLPALLGERDGAPPRDHLILQNNGESPLALRQGDWMLIQKGGGPRPQRAGSEPGFELYNLATDLTQSRNLYGEKRETVERLRKLLAQYKTEGRTAPLRTQQPAQKKEPLGEARVYKTVGNRGLKLFVVKPDGWKVTDQRPGLVLFHGGGWIGGSPAQLNPQAEYLASRGMVCALVQYRFVKKPAATPTVCIQDAKSAMRWVRSHAAELGINPQRIGAAGGSAGGHLAAFTGMVDGLDDPSDDLTVSARPAATVLFNPVFNNGPGQYGHDRVGDRFKEFSPAHNITSN